MSPLPVLLTTMHDQAKAAFASAADSTKQIITLSTGLLALEITFAKYLLAAGGPRGRWLLSSSWVLLLLSVVAGVWTLLALTGSLSSGRVVTSRTIMGTNVRVPAALQVVLFVLGLGFTVAFGIWGSQ